MNGNGGKHSTIRKGHKVETEQMTAHLEVEEEAKGRGIMLYFNNIHMTRI